MNNRLKRDGVIKYKDKSLSKKKKKDMTTVLGINCSNGIVICSESQETYGNGFIRQATHKKILSLNEYDKYYCNIAGLGSFEYTEKFYSKLEEQAKANYLVDDNTFIIKCEDIIHGITNRYIIKKAENLGLFTRYREMILNYEYWNRMIDKYIDLGLIIGFLVKNDKNSKPILFYIDNIGVSKKIDDYDVVGTGSTIAEYFLSKFWFKDIDVIKASYLAIYIMNEVKKIDSKSGGKTQISIIDNSGFVKLTDSIGQKSDYKKYIDGIGETLKQKWVNLLTEPDIIEI